MTTRRHIVPPVHRIREPFATIVERVMERDRAYFEEHPDAQMYARPYVPGELPPDSLAAIGISPPDQDTVIVVRQIRPGVRVRGLLPAGERKTA